MVIAQGKSRWELSLSKNNLTKKLLLQALHSEWNWLGVTFGEQLYMAQNWALRKLERKYYESFKMRSSKRMEKKWPDKVT